MWPGFVLNPENQVITEEQRTLTERLLLERILLHGICRAMGVGLRWLLQFMIEWFQDWSRPIFVRDYNNLALDRQFGRPVPTQTRGETE